MCFEKELNQDLKLLNHDPILFVHLNNLGRSRQHYCIMMGDLAYFREWFQALADLNIDHEN